jgi:hypothetical protein
MIPFVHGFADVFQMLIDISFGYSQLTRNLFGGEGRLLKKANYSMTKRLVSFFRDDRLPQLLPIDHFPPAMCRWFRLRLP